MTRHTLPAALAGNLVRFRGQRAGDLACYIHGNAAPGVPPLVLIHSINAAASSFEMKPLYDHYARTRRVIALDLPGYGFSSRADRPYLPALMRDAILDLVEQVCDGVTVDAVALSLSAEFLALAAQDRPALFATLTMLTPTGFSRRSQSIHGSDRALRILRAPLWRRALYATLTSRPSVSYFVQANQKTKPGRAFIDYAWTTCRQPGAEFAPLYFLAFKLFTPSILDVYRQLAQPCALIHGEDKYATCELADEVAGKPNWRVTRVDGAGALVHWDRPDVVIGEIDRLLAAQGR